MLTIFPSAMPAAPAAALAWPAASAVALAMAVTLAADPVPRAVACPVTVRPSGLPVEQHQVG